MLSILLKRLALLPVMILIVATIGFLLVKAAPGSAFTDDKAVPPEVLEKAKAYYGLDQPIYVQYGRYITNLAQGDLGPCLKLKAYTVNEIIAESAPISLELGAYSIIIALLIGIPLGVIAAINHNKWQDYSAMMIAMTGICLPAFVLGPALLFIFSIHLGWFNPLGWDDPSDRVLPSLSIGLYIAASIARLTRTGMLDILNQDFIRTARAKGLSTWTIIYKHTLRGALLPVVNYLGPALASVLAGSFVVETIFGIPGIGRHFVNAAFNRDEFLVLGSVIFFSFLLILMNLAVDIVQLMMDPRARKSES